MYSSKLGSVEGELRENIEILPEPYQKIVSAVSKSLGKMVGRESLRVYLTQKQLEDFEKSRDDKNPSLSLTSRLPYGYIFVKTSGDDFPDPHVSEQLKVIDFSHKLEVRGEPGGGPKYVQIQVQVYYFPDEEHPDKLVTIQDETNTIIV